MPDQAKNVLASALGHLARLRRVYHDGNRPGIRPVERQAMRALRVAEFPVLIPATASSVTHRPISAPHRCQRPAQNITRRHHHTPKLTLVTSHSFWLSGLG